MESFWTVWGLAGPTRRISVYGSRLLVLLMKSEIVYFSQSASYDGLTMKVDSLLVSHSLSPPD